MENGLVVDSQSGKVQVLQVLLSAQMDDETTDEKDGFEEGDLYTLEFGHKILYM